MTSSWSLDYPDPIHLSYVSTGHFTVVCLVPWSLTKSEARGDLVFFFCKPCRFSHVINDHVDGLVSMGITCLPLKSFSESSLLSPPYWKTRRPWGRGCFYA